MLSTCADLEDGERYLNAATPAHLLDHRIIPIINENDARGHRRIKVGTTATSLPVPPSRRMRTCWSCSRIRRQTTADPRTNPDAQLIEEVQTIDDTLRSLPVTA